MTIDLLVALILFANHIGLLNAADYYGLEELRRACIGFVTCCITVDTVNSILASAERYIQYKCTKSLVQRVGSLIGSCIFLFRLSPS